MPAPMISIENLQKNYGSTHALRGVSFHIPRGQVVGFLGPNGAGKSTTMKILTGFVEASAGTVKVGDIDVARDPIGARKRIGYLPESNPLYEEMMVQEYLEYMADVRQLKRSERQSRIEGAVNDCGLLSVRHKDIGQLSKGFRQRVGLAAAILHDPDLLILDEPTTGLDPNQVVEIRELIKRLGEEKTVLMSTHILPEVQATCSRVLIINDGQVVADDSPDNLSGDTAEASEGAQLQIELVPRNGTAPRTSEVREFLTALPGVRDVIAVEPEEEGGYAFTLRTSTDDPRRRLFEAAVEHGLILMRLERKRVSLEDTFRRLTTQDQEATKQATQEATKKEGAS